MSVSSGPRGTARRIVFAVHLWCGLILGIYLVAISVSGSVLVYRNELRAAFQPQPRLVDASGTRLSEDELIRAGEAAYPDHEVFVYTMPEEDDHAVSLGVNLGESRRQILFDPYTGDDLGNAVPWGWRATTWLIDFHGTLAAGPTGKRINGVGSILFTGLIITGIVLWWPGFGRLLRGLRIERDRGTRRLLFTLHGALGAVSFALLLLWAVTGIYLTFPEPFSAAADWIEPLDEESFEPRFVDDVLYWIAYVHFGRFGGEPTKLIWALFGLAPPALFGTGLALWLAKRRRTVNRAG